jgi:hypothetical protein
MDRAAAKRSENQRLHCPTTSRLEAGATARPGESYSDVIIRLVAARPAYMKAVREFWLARTIMVFGAMFVWAQAHSQDLSCNNGCGAYAKYALAQRLQLPASIQDMPRAKIEAWFIPPLVD